jgi:hypothetical protein
MSKINESEIKRLAKIHSLTNPDILIKTQDLIYYLQEFDCKCQLTVEEFINIIDKMDKYSLGIIKINV